MRAKKFLQTLFLLFIAVYASGCTGSSLALLKERVSTEGAHPLIEEDSFQNIDLALLLDPDSKGLKPRKESTPGVLRDIGSEFGRIFNRKKYTSSQEEINGQRQILRDAFKAFNENSLGIIDRRNQVQERILAASNQRCAEFKRHLKKADAQSNFFLGALTTSLAGAGAIFTPVNTVRALAGLAAITSGVRAEFNEVYFQTKTIQVITDGIGARRKKIYERILSRQKTSITAYPVEAAIEDSVTYHDNCSLIAGLEEAALSIERAENPGMVAMQKVLIQSKNLQRIMNADPNDPTLYTRGIIDPIVKFDRAGTDLLDDGSAIGRGSPLNFYASTRSQISRLANALLEHVKKLESNKEKLKGSPTDKQNIGNFLTAMMGDKGLIRSAEKKTKDLLAKKFQEEAKEIDGKIRVAWANLKETLPGDEIIIRKLRLALEDEKTGETVNNQIRGVFRFFQTYLENARSTLVAVKEIGDLTPEVVKKAKESLDTLIAGIQERDGGKKTSETNTKDPKTEGADKKKEKSKTKKGKETPAKPN